MVYRLWFLQLSKEKKNNKHSFTAGSQIYALYAQVTNSYLRKNSGSSWLECGLHFLEPLSQYGSLDWAQRRLCPRIEGRSWGYSSSHVRTWQLDHKEDWMPKNWCFWAVVLEKTIESPFDDKEIEQVHPKWNQCWIIIGRTNAEAEALILWPPDMKNWLIKKDSNAGEDGRQEKGMTKNEMIGWCHPLDGYGFEQTLGVSNGQGDLVCCRLWGHREWDMAEWLNGLTEKAEVMQKCQVASNFSTHLIISQQPCLPTRRDLALSPRQRRLPGALEAGWVWLLRGTPSTQEPSHLHCGPLPTTM